MRCESKGMLKDRAKALRETRLFAPAYNLGNFLRTLALPEAVEHWSLTTLREKLGHRAGFSIAKLAR